MLNNKNLLLLGLIVMMVCFFGFVSDSGYADVPQDAVSASLTRLEAVHAQRVDDNLSRMSTKEREEYVDFADENGSPLNKLMISWSWYGIPRSINGFNLQIPTVSPSKELNPFQCALHFFREYRDLFQMKDPGAELELKRESTDIKGNRHVFLKQVYAGLPVFGAEVAVHLNTKNEVIGINGLYLPLVSISPTPAVSKEDALDIVRKDLDRELSRAPIDAELGVFNPEAFDSKERPALVWRITADHYPNPIYFIDAERGTILHHYYDIENSLSMETWMHTDSPGNECPGDADVFVYGINPNHFIGEWPGTSWHIAAGTVRTYTYYYLRHGRDSYDGAGATLYTCSDCGFSPTSSGAGNFGGEGPSFGACAACTDVVGHELTHKYINHLADFVGTIQGNSLCESFCDVFGEFIEDWFDGPADWLQRTKGNCDTDTCTEGPLRSLMDPPSIGGDPDHWNNFNWDGDFWGHDNCGIPSKSAWLLGRDPSEGWVTHYGVGVRGIGISYTETIWYSALANWLPSIINFTDFGEAIQNAAWSMYGLSDQYTQSRRSIMAIGLWSPDNGQNFLVDYRVSLVPKFTVNGQWRKYIFYKEWEGADPPLDLCYRYRTCALYGTCSWSEEQKVSRTSHAPSAVIYDNKIWTFFRYRSGDILSYLTIDENDVILKDKLYNGEPLTDEAPSAVVFNDKIYVFYKSVGSGSTTIQYLRYDGSWTEPLSTGFESTNGPMAAATLDDKLWLFWRGDANAIHYSSMDTEENWSAVYTVPNDAMTYDTPAVAIYRNRLHVATTDPNSVLNDIYYTSCDLPCTNESDWTRNVKQDHGSRPLMTLFKDVDGWLYLFHRGANSHILNWRKKFSE